MTWIPFCPPLIEVSRPAKCKRCGRYMWNVKEGWADFCYDCEDEKK